MNLIIRKATIDDLAIIKSMQAKLALHERKTDKLLKQRGKIHFSSGKAIRSIITSTKGECLIAEIKDLPVGMCLIEKRTNPGRFSEYKEKGYIAELYIKTGFRRMGVGTKLINEALDWFKQNDLVDIRLNVFVNNINAIEAYKKIGFKDRLIEMKYDKEKTFKGAL